MSHHIDGTETAVVEATQDAPVSTQNGAKVSLSEVFSEAIQAYKTGDLSQAFSVVTENLANVDWAATFTHAVAGMVAGGGAGALLGSPLLGAAAGLIGGALGGQQVTDFVQRFTPGAGPAIV